jgi:hypothetical protein
MLKYFKMLRKLSFLFLLLSTSIVFSQPSGNQIQTTNAPERKITSIPKIQKKIEFDGLVEVDEWGYIDTLSMVSHWPTYSQRPNTKTLFRVAYDETFFYFSAICFDDPMLIQGPYFERDKWELSEDQVAVILDTFNDNENGLLFVVTPTGSRVDASVKNDAQSDPPDKSWNSFWEAKVSKNSKGWMVEARIPFSSLRFQQVNKNVAMGFRAFRYVAREKQLDVYPDTPPNWGFYSFLKPSKANDVSFSGIKNKRPWFTSPYLLTGFGYHHNKPTDASEFEKLSDNQINAGLDVQHAITDNLNLDVTVNTDFAQVEADNQVVNLSRFSLFFPEKRRFFLERSSVMDFNFDNNNRLFYSRRIGINDGKIAPLWGGARLVGRINNYDVGFMTIQSREKQDLPSENYGVLRLRRRISKNNSYVGGIVTSRSNLNGSNNLSYGVDGIINLFKNDYLKVNLAQTYNSLDTISYSNFINDRKRIYVMWENRSQVGFNYSLSYSQVDKNYQPGLGFEARNNFKAVGDRLSYGWFPTKKTNLRYLKFDINATSFFSNTTSQVESFLVAPSFYMEWNKNNNFQLTVTRFQDKPPAAFNLSETIIIPSGTYINNDINIFYQTPGVNFLSSSFSATTGNFYGGKRFSSEITPTYIISKYLTLSGFYQFNHIDFAGSADYVSHVGRLKIATSLNVKLSVNTFVQFNSLTKVSAVNFRLRYNTKDGNDFYLVYNEAMNHTGKSDPYLPFSDYRNFILKYIYTFHVGR